MPPGRVFGSKGPVPADFPWPWGSGRRNRAPTGSTGRDCACETPGPDPLSDRGYQPWSPRFLSQARSSIPLFLLAVRLLDRLRKFTIITTAVSTVIQQRHTTIRAGGKEELPIPDESPSRYFPSPSP